MSGSAARQAGRAAYRPARKAARAVLAGAILIAAAPHPAPAAGGSACLRAARAATRLSGLPRGLLAAIGIVETGRPDPATGRLMPSPYAVDIRGRGKFFADAAHAAAYVRRARDAGATLIDVGCFQIDLGFHPDAFPDLAAAFDPAANAAYAARFLTRLHARFGTWPQAIAAYHSASPEHGAPYAARVLATWHGGGSAAATPPPKDPHVIRLGAEPDNLPRVVGP